MKRVFRKLTSEHGRTSGFGFVDTGVRGKFEWLECAARGGPHGIPMLLYIFGAFILLYCSFLVARMFF